MAKIGIVTVLYNSASVLEDYFDSLSKQTFKDFVLIVIDNKSPDDSLDKANRLALKYSSEFETVVIANEGNYGVANGNNIGVKKSKEYGCKYVLLSNNDIELKPDCIEKCLRKAEDCKIELIAPKVYFFDEPLLWYAGGDFKWIAGTIRQWGYLSKDDKPEYNQTRFVDYAPTCFMLIKISVFDEIGLFDERYFVYYDDTDWVYRCKVAGKKLLYYPETCIWHKESTSTGGMKSDFYLHYANRNKIYFCRKNYNKFKLLVTLIAIPINYLLNVRPHITPHQRDIVRKAYIEGLKLRINE